MRGPGLVHRLPEGPLPLRTPRRLQPLLQRPLVLLRPRPRLEFRLELGRLDPLLVPPCGLRLGLRVSDLLLQVLALPLALGPLTPRLTGKRSAPPRGPQGGLGRG